MIFYIADLHFGHKNIISHCSRPFNNVDEMNDVLINNWNRVVAKIDTVYIVGDFAYRSPTSMKPILEQLNGIKHLIIGNHDVDWLKNLNPKEYFASVNSLLEIDDGDTHITLCHYPLMTWNRMAYGAIHIHGHLHNDLKNYQVIDMLKKINAYNAGVDVNDFMPVTLQQLKLNKETFYNKIGIIDEKAIALKIATVAHNGQKDKQGIDYINHPITVSSYCKTERARIAGLLHDIIEDTSMTANVLREAGIGEDVIAAVEYLSKNPQDTINGYLTRLSGNDIAVEVKFADMRHNTDINRSPIEMQDFAKKKSKKIFC